jgi:hypothetical protein
MLPLGVLYQTNPPPRGFVTRWTVAGDAAARTITLPLIYDRTEGVLAYNCTVDWGDGSPTSTVTAYDDVNAIHTYAADGTYEVEISGTCEGWSFNYGGDRLKIVAIVGWGSASLFNGFAYLMNGFAGCTNLTSIGSGPILASGAGVGEQGFYGTFAGCKMPSVSANIFWNHAAVTLHAFDSTFNGCSLLTGAPANLFRYAPLASQYAFNNTFGLCAALAAIPANLFKYNTLASIQGFTGTFSGCTSITSVPADLFRYCTLVTDSGFNSCFYGCTALASVPADLFRYNTLVSTGGFQQTFYQCSSLTAIPTDLFRYNTLVTTNGFRSCFYRCTSLTTVPADLFRYNTAVSTYGFRSTFNGCSSLESVPADLFRYNVAVSTGGFQYTFLDCVKLQANKNIFYADGEQGTRFNHGLACDFTNCFNRTSFTGSQGTSPDLWECDFGETITLDVAPATDWDPGDVVTGQSSGATSVVVSRTSALVYQVRKYLGTYALDEVVGVTGVPAKLADQGAANPVLSARPVSAGCYGGAGNSLTSLDNYADVPSDWK